MPLHNDCSESEPKQATETTGEIENDEIADEIPETLQNPNPEIQEHDDELIIPIVDCTPTSNKEFNKADLSQFTLLSVLGQGSFGKVYMVKKNTAPMEGHLFAMKVLKKATLKVRDRLRTKMERDILAEIQHPFIVQLHFAFQTAGKLFLVIDLVRGGDLFTRLSKEVMFTEDDVKFYLAEIAMALDHLHKCGIIYRDLKPENILLEVDGHVKLTDFGLCKEAVIEDKKTYSFCGTIEYMAPEVITRKGHGPAADWWSFAVLMFEMLSGSLPFHSQNRRDTMNLVLKARIPMPYNFSVDAQKILRLLFKRNPENRLGFKEGLKEISAQPFFLSINFDKLYYKQISCPFKPTVANAYSSNYFFNQSCPLAESPGINSALPQLFKDFSFVAPLAQEDRKQYIQKDSKASTEDIMGALPVHTSNIFNDYRLLEVVGEGSFSVVHKATNKVNCQTYAIKVIPREKRSCAEEIDILLRYSEHPNIATLRDVYASPENYYLVMEYLRGGDLLARINRQKSYSEKEAAYLLETLTNTICYLHDHGVVHRDLKPSNIMFYDESGKPESVRITDFGFAKQIRAENGMLMTPCYTANYVAPEVLRLQGYDAACDIWSLGIILYATLSGTTPYMNFDKEDPTVIYNRISQGEINLTHGIWTKISDEAKDLILSMMNVDPYRRIKAHDILKHPWIMKKEKLSDIRLQQETWRLKDAMKMMFNAFHKTNEVKNLLPISNSTIIKRRANKNEKKH